MRIVFCIQKCRKDGLLLSFRGHSFLSILYNFAGVFFKIKSNEKSLFTSGHCAWGTKSLAQPTSSYITTWVMGCMATRFLRAKISTATVENFSADKWGSTYFFMDADFGDNVLRGAYGEFSREIQTKKMPVAFHVEYNGGLSYGTGKRDGYAFGDAYLAGAAYN